MARVPVRMPKMSMTMTEGELNSWAIEVGDAVRSGDVICEVLTDKVDMEVESPATGTLVEIVVSSGMVPVGEPIGWIEAEGDSFTDLLDLGGDDEPAAAGEDLGSELADGGTPAPPDPAAQTAGTPAGSVPAAPAPVPAGPVPAVPRARALARAGGLDLTSVSPTGPGGVVSVRDVEQALAPEPVASPPVAPSSADGPPFPRAVLSPPQRKRAAAQAASPGPVPDRPEVSERAAVGGTPVVDPRTAAVRRAVARKMTESAAVPQFTVWRDLRLDVADTHRDGLSWTTVLLQSYARALRHVPGCSPGGTATGRSRRGRRRWPWPWTASTA